MWGRLALSLVKAHPGAELYWFLISQGYKTYRFLPVFFHEFYPGFLAPTPERAQRAIDALALARYPHAYDRQAGVIRAGARQYRLQEGLADVTPARLRDDHVRFFQTRNPGHERGDELCCLAPLSRAILQPPPGASSAGSPRKFKSREYYIRFQCDVDAQM